MRTVKSIFLIEDDPDDQEIFGDALTTVDDSISLNVAGDGMEALDMLAAGTMVLPDVIFLDMNMPRMNGMQFLSSIKQLNQFKDIPVIIYSTASRIRQQRETLALGAAHFIEKPDNFKQLCLEIQQVLIGNFTV